MSCIKEGCKEPKTENAYCKKHKVNFLIEEGEKLGQRICSNVIRGCREVNDLTYTKKKCETCLEKERVREKARRTTKEEVEEGMKQCTTCSKVCPLDQFKGRLGETKTCFTCREQNKRADALRDMDHTRELARTNSAKPERKEVKKEWREENYEKQTLYWLEHQKRKIQTDLDAYFKKKAAQAKNWRDSNPDKMKQRKMNRHLNMKLQYKTYQKSALDRRLDFKFSFEEYEQLVRLPCYYCGIIQEKGFNGIDRLNSSETYSQTNSVSCCSMCNMMKGCSGPNIFVRRIEHILTNLNVIEGRLYPDYFINFRSGGYFEYKKGAETRDLSFEISQETFCHYKNLPCYLCGKDISETHCNGIDRFDSKKGYTLENIRSCCGVCNFIKKSYVYEDMIDKFCLIYDHQQDHPIAPSLYEEEKRMIVKGNKFTSEEKQERYAISKEANRKMFFDKYSNDDYIKSKAAELGLKYKEKKELDGLKE